MNLILSLTRAGFTILLLLLLLWLFYTNFVRRSLPSRSRFPWLWSSSDYMMHVLSIRLSYNIYTILPVVGSSFMSSHLSLVRLAHIVRSLILSHYTNATIQQSNTHSTVFSSDTQYQPQPLIIWNGTGDRSETCLRWSEISSMMSEDAKSDFNKLRPIYTPFPENTDNVAITMKTS